MSELLAKLTELGYELFSVIIPGTIFTLFFLLWWYALGGLAPLWTSHVVPEMTIELGRTMVESLEGVTGAIPAIVIAYLAGHLILWISRSGSQSEGATNALTRTLLSLCLRIPKAVNNYDPNLQEMFSKVQDKLATGSEWRKFYPVAKNFLSQKVASSLVNNYQNKYTLHRSLTVVGAIVFWLALIAIASAMLLVNPEDTSPNFALLCTIMVGGLAIVCVFSSSYIYYWQMFGNTLVTETYAYIFGPKDDQP